MPNLKEKHEQLRRWRIRKKVSGSKDRPRMSVRFTNEHIYVQFIDDFAKITLASTSTLGKSVPDRDKLSANVASAKRLGALAACAVVLAAGAIVHRPLSRVPENILKFGVGVMLSAFGVFWTGEGLGIAWPGADFALLLFAALFLGAGLLASAFARKLAEFA